MNGSRNSVPLNKLNMHYGEFTRKMGSNGTGNMQFDQLFDVMVDPSGNIYVSDRGVEAVKKYDSDFGFITKWGTLVRQTGSWTMFSA